MTPNAPAIGEQRRFYDELWVDVEAASLNRHERARLEAITRLLYDNLRTAPPPKILEVGCGRGWLSGLLLQRLGRVTAFDLSPHAVQKARARFPNVSFEARDVFTEPLPPGNDLVVSSEVLEHVEDQATFVELLSEALNPDGLLLLTTPNGRWKQRWLARSDVRPQPVEDWLTPSALAALVTRHCDVIAQTTLFLPWRTGSRVGRTMMWLDGHAGDLAPGHLVAKFGGGLYSIVLARRRPPRASGAPARA